MNNCKIKIIIESKLTNLPLLRKTIRGICSCVVENEQVVQDIELCMNEALSNVISHAYQSEPGHEIQIIVTLSEGEIVFQIIDTGLKNPMHHLILHEKNLNTLDPLSESGRGLLIINQLMNEVVYKSEQDRNILFMRKCL